VDAHALENALRREIEGEVRFDKGSRALYSTDASNYRQVPIGVVIPRSVTDVIQTVACCREFNAPILSRGGGTSIAGQCCNVAVVMDMSKYVNRILEIDSHKKKARVEPGVILDDLRKATRPYGLTFGPDPATHSRCTFGGMIGNNSCGVHSIMAGKTVDNVESMEILTYDGLRFRVGKTSDEEIARKIREGGRSGQIYAKLQALQTKYADLIQSRYPKIPRRVSGYNLDQLLPENGFDLARALVGTEGTCVTVLEATVKLIEDPPYRSLVVLSCAGIDVAADKMQDILEDKPMGLEGLDEYFIRNMKKKGLHQEAVSWLPEGKAWLFVEFGGQTQKECSDHAHSMKERLSRQIPPSSIKIFDDPIEQHKVWEVREAAFGVTSFVPGQKNMSAGWEDSAVPPEKMGNYLRDLRKLTEKFDYNSVFYGHLADGCIHARISFDLQTDPGVEKYKHFVDEAAELVLSYGGSLSGEHGDGQTRAHLLPKMFGHELIQAFREFKTIWDPDGKMNPGKIVDAYPVDENLRLQAEPHMALSSLHFQFPEDSGRFDETLLRCVGIGRCRKKSNETMCPSFMATLEEKHSTRGRARLLFEMLQGEVITDGWQSQEVKDSLDLCLSCKGCRSECPTQVDMATYKAEFLSHYYQKKMRPLSAYAMGWIAVWSRMASRTPFLANFFTQTPHLDTLFKSLAGISTKRRLPRFAPQTFQRWSQCRKSVSPKGRDVILWPDTMNNYFYPGIAQAAMEVLEAVGYRVMVPKQALCCARPLFDYGFLDQAKKWLRSILETLRPQLVEDVPVVVLEPSCAAVFRDELINLFPRDPIAQRLHDQTFLLAEFLVREGKENLFSPLRKRALMHGHCHQKALMGMAHEAKLCTQLGLDFEILDSGCCGMAGAFGFEKDHYDISVKIGEKVLLPAVRNADRETLIITDGFSCREQILQLSNRPSLHLAEVLRMTSK